MSDLNKRDLDNYITGHYGADQDLGDDGDSIYVLEYRTRDRKNGKWTEWSSSEPEDRNLTAYREYPAAQVFAHEKYEKRAVEYRRVEP